ncbi:hypothetical protein CH375_00370 [Leptospira ellisii]|uniref:Uncharacterized protein n=1 Tax=Leptospira ellisii TaxID=2023197 RepID=A0A2N0BQU5_9LEPT|nr:hypothetical protein CH379_06445 [Leptospira ellisii]PKA06325.1 hypothetical protein CH375_00370 [Leptospira ellisii]
MFLRDLDFMPFSFRRIRILKDRRSDIHGSGMRTYAGFIRKTDARRAYTFGTKRRRSSEYEVVARRSGVRSFRSVVESGRISEMTFPIVFSPGLRS